MKQLFLLAAFAVAFVSSWAADVPRVDAREAARLVKDEQAVLIDVREPGEWAESGVAEPALLLPTSDFNGARTHWNEALKNLPKDKPVVLYCRSGARSGRIAQALAKEGYRTVNGGTFKDWQAAGLPVRMAEQK